MSKSEKEARVLAVTSGKGGVGKTNIALNLAVALASRVQRVVLWDGDMGLANVQVLMRLHPQGDLSDVLAERKTIQEIIIDTPSGVRVVPGASGDEHMANLNARERKLFADALRELLYDNDYIIIDTGAGISANIMDFARIADDIIVVTTPEPTALIDAYAAIKVAHQRAPWSDIHLVMNMARDMKEAKRAMLRLESITAGYIGSHLLEEGVLLFDEAMRDAVRHREPVIVAYPESQPAAAIWAMAESFLNEARFPTVKKKAPSAGVVERLRSLFSHS